jgi:hypothetical protein
MLTPKQYLDVLSKATASYSSGFALALSSVSPAMTISLTSTFTENGSRPCCFTASRKASSCGRIYSIRNADVNRQNPSGKPCVAQTHLFDALTAHEEGLGMPRPKRDPRQLLPA